MNMGLVYDFTIQKFTPLAENHIMSMHRILKKWQSNVSANAKRDEAKCDG
jgi:hypothetical protein